MRYLFAVLLIFALANHAAQAADQQSKARQIAHAVLSLTKELNTAVIDSTEMVQGALNSGSMRDREYEAHVEIMTTAESIESLAEQYYLLTVIYSLMVSDKDRATVLEYLRISHKRADEIVEPAINMINRALPRLKSPALVSQSERIRDTVRKIKETIGSWNP